jgi:hypothetical protein
MEHNRRETNSRQAGQENKSMSPEGVLPYSLEHATGPNPGPDESSYTIITHFFKIHFSTIFTSMPSSPKWSLSFRISD